MTARLLMPVAAICALASCESGVSTLTIAERQAEWASRGPASYSFSYAVQASLYRPGCPSATWTVTVRNRINVGAVCVATAQYDSSMRATVDSVFAEARRIAGYGNVASIEFDTTYGYPTSVVYAGPPDAGSSEQLSDLVPLQPPTSVQGPAFVTKP